MQVKLHVGSELTFQWICQHPHLTVRWICPWSPQCHHRHRHCHPRCQCHHRRHPLLRQGCRHYRRHHPLKITNNYNNETLAHSRKLKVVVCNVNELL